jgi:hypothetical protein
MIVAHHGSHLSAINRGRGTNDLTFLSNGGLGAAFAKRATIGVSKLRFGTCVWSAVPP